jgi:hypothetical protein
MAVFSRIDESEGIVNVPQAVKLSDGETVFETQSL